MSRRCTCHSGFNWEYGPCDYCSSDICEECEQHPDYCECEEESEEE